MVTGRSPPPPSPRSIFPSRYFVSVITVILGGSAQFYSYGVVNPSQSLISDWINQTYTDRRVSPSFCIPSSPY